MSTEPRIESVLDVNIRTQHVEALTSWRKLYLRIFEELRPRSVVEFGCGHADLLSRLPSDVRRVGLDGNPNYAEEYAAAGIEFHAFDFDSAEPPVGLEGFAAAVCSDVFEHLLYPQTLLRRISQILAADGVLLSQVPNEFRVGSLLPVLLGRETSVVFHGDTDEWTNPHLRRFTDIGYQNFLRLEFEYNVPLTPLNFPKLARGLARLGLPVPFGLQNGPTYASTHSPETSERLRELVAKLPGR